MTTKTLGRIAKSHISNRGKATDELRLLVSRQNTYEIAFPAAAMYMTQIDGEYSVKEKEFYRALLSRMSFEEHTQAEFQKLLKSEGNILEAIAQIEDEELKSSLVEVMVLMAVYDGELVEAERCFLIKTAAHLNVPLDIDEVERRAGDYRIVVEKNVFQKAVGTTKDTASKAMGVAGQTAGSVKGAATAAGSKVTGAFGKVLQRKKDEGESKGVDTSIVICANCGKEVPAEYKFCPGCGQAITTEKNCVSCSEVIPVDFSFCPHCGASQN